MPIRSVARFLRAVPVLALVISAATGCVRGEGPERIVLVVIDTLRRDHLSIHGADVQTPNIANLAAMGTAIPNAVSSFHQTTMSMGALFTGQTPSIESGDPKQSLAMITPNWCGMARFDPENLDDGCVPHAMQTLGEVMRDRGYWTAAVVSNRFLFEPAGFAQGFDEWVEVGSSEEVRSRKDLPRAALQRSGPKVNDAVRRLLDERLGDRFFLYVHYMDVHDWHQRRLTYAQAVEVVDESIGDLMALLGREGLMEGAVVILVGDHGERLGEEHLLRGLPAHYGNPSFETVLDVPLIVVGADVSEVDAPLRSEDLYYLMTQMVNAPPPTTRDLAPGELFLSEAWYRTYRKGRWKSFWRRIDGGFHLVDLEADPEERVDVSALHPQIAAAHKQRMQDLAQRTAAPNAPIRTPTRLEIEMLQLLGYMDLSESAPSAPPGESTGN
jgi:arylsulfatase A-like enzyme